MYNRLITFLGTTFVLAVTAVPAMAGTFQAISVPEPATITLLGVGIAGAFVARKFLGRK